MKTHQYTGLEEALKPYFELMEQAAETIVDQDVSLYPLFVVHQEEEVSLGIPLVQPEPEANGWAINISTLEELATKKIVLMEKVDEFREVYNEHEAYFCLFVADKEQPGFAFVLR